MKFGKTVTTVGKHIYLFPPSATGMHTHTLSRTREHTRAYKPTYAEVIRRTFILFIRSVEFVIAECYP